MLVGERRNGNLLVQLGPKLQAQPEELLRQRWSPGGCTEYLIRWAVQNLEDGAESTGAVSQSESKASSILMWMSAEEVYTNCPTLLGKRKAEGSGLPEEKASRAPDEGALREMRDDVRMLVQRAARQMSQSSGPDSSILNTIHVLSAYASISSLAGVFKETGALDLLMKMLCNQEKQIRNNAGKMLRALASHDAGSRAHVLLSLSQQDGIEQHMDFESRYTLLQLFAETTSSEEHCMSFEGIQLPYVYGKQLFSLVKCYLRVTSLLDKLSKDQLDHGKKNQLQGQFDFSMAMGSLICELVHIMGWVREQDSQLCRKEGLRSIFHGGRLGHCQARDNMQTFSNFKRRSDFSSRSSYEKYLWQTLVPGVIVRMTEDCNQLKCGDQGTFLQRRQGTQSLEVYWRSLKRTSWVDCHMLEIMSCPGETSATQLAESLSVTPGAPIEEHKLLRQDEWWELLFFIRRLKPEERQEVLQVIKQSQEVIGYSEEAKLSDLDEHGLIEMVASVDLAHKILRFMRDNCNSCVLADLQSAHIFTTFFLQVEAEQQSLHSSTPTQDNTFQRGRLSKKLKTEESTSTDQIAAISNAEKSDLQLLTDLITLEGLQPTDLKEEEKRDSRTLEKDISQAAAVQDMDLQTLLTSLKESKMCRDLLPSLERCVCDGVYSLCCEVSELLTNSDFFLQLLSSLEQLRAEKRPQLSIYRIFNKALDFYQEDVLPWHRSIEPSLTSLGSGSSDHEVLQEVVSFLYRLASTNKDCAVVMCRLGTKEILGKVVEKQSSSILQASELRDLLTDCEKYASLYQKMATSILAGCIQMVLGQIEEHRRSQQPINIPFFDVFLRNLCQGSSVEVKEDKCWEKIEVSSNPHRANKLTDGNLKSYWESNGSTGSHYINIFMHRGVVIRQLVLTVASEDSSYMPARVVVMGGENPSSINTELNSVNISSVAVRVLLLENLTRFWPIIQIKIKRCQQGGIDTRVRGLEVFGPKPTFWPVFKEQLCRRTFLFYTSRAHSWGQEICEKRENLLQLFSRLNRALSHEQEFAERFLVDDEAAQALGRTCWEALIAPLVQSITTPDDNVSPLSWLFTKYLENAQTFRRPKSRSSVFNSHVRRLTRLLVHVDTSLPDTEALKPPSKSSEAIKGRGGKAPGEAADGKTRGSAGISVRSSMAGIAACWQGVIQHQVQKFLEISWNNLDLVPKFCSLYLALRRAMEELFGQQTLFLLSLRQGFCEGLLHLSFLTALHVTEQFARYIDQRIQEIRTDSSNLHSMNQLQLFLEFVVFLSDLELANSFEHFYRHYLADRLLSLGPCWLENSVVDHIGICFPNRFPQQMLKNLQEAKELQKDQHLFSLQEFDTGVLSEDMEEEEVMEEDPLPLEEKEDLELQVSVLSPRCWAVSPLCYMDDPCKHFPECLSSSLERFTNFYSKSQYALSSEVSQLRRLQWTWLGSAELQYGELTLHVSTLQMFILLLFNQQEEISQQSILQSTGLSQILMEHALTPLIANGGILACNQKSGLLSLNDMVQVEAGPGKAFRLFPKQMYLNVEEDEGRTLERKRNIIFCLITQIMKVEKELHIDNLVFRVVEACQKWESGTSPKILSFVCSHTDVLSCIMHLISQGYVQRNEDSPHILEYISKDPSTPHKGKANILFQNSSRNKQENDQKSSPSSGKGTEQGVLETILLPMGRTLSQEEVWTLISQMVTQVSDTLTVTPDVAQHLLIHCKWNVDLLLQKYTDDSELLLTASGLKVENSQPPDTLLPTCPVCVIPLSPSDSPPTLCCMHFCCKSCWKEYLTTRIEQNLVLNCTCPTTDCPAQPTSSFIRTLISSTEVIEKYEKALLRGFVESCSNLTWCTNPQGCDQVLCKEGLSSGTACAKCSWHSCFTCNFPEAHYPASCSHMSQWMDDGGFYEGMTVEAQSKHLTKLISKHCPSCQAPIEKNEGCLHMTCAKCNHGFCWRCLKPWKPTHKDYYNCSAMVSKAARQEKRFQDYNERCTFQHRAKDFAVSLRNRLSILSENLPLRTLTLLITSCRVLEQSRKVLGYSCVYSYYNQDSERLDVLESQTENLEVHVSALQILLEDSLLQSTDLSSCVRLLKSDQYNRGLELVRRVQERLQGILQHSTQDFRVGYLSQPDQKDIKLSNVPAAEMTTATDTVDGTSESGDTAGEQDDEDDDEYVPEWHEEYDEDLDEDDFSYDEEDGSENLEPDSFIFEDDDADAYE